jgi:hypothetical protein
MAIADMILRPGNSEFGQVLPQRLEKDASVGSVKEKETNWANVQLKKS